MVPNCAAELEEYNDKQRRLKCGNCSLELPALAHFELMEIKKTQSGEALELLVRLVQPRRELDRVQQAPEVIARIREMRLSRRGDATGVNAAEDDSEPRRENVRYGARSRRAYAASGSPASRSSSRSSRRLRRSSPETVVGKRGRRGSTRTTLTVGSQLP